jgi:hypothetical protein
MSLAVAINIILDVGIVLAILAVLVWGMRAQVRDLKMLSGERRDGTERRRVARRFPAHAERRAVERRGGRSVVTERP